MDRGLGYRLRDDESGKFLDVLEGGNLKNPLHFARIKLVDLSSADGIVSGVVSEEWIVSEELLEGLEAIPFFWAIPEVERELLGVE